MCWRLVGWCGWWLVWLAVVVVVVVVMVMAVEVCCLLAAMTQDSAGRSAEALDQSLLAARPARASRARNSE